MARYMTLDAYKAALEEATGLIARSPEPASTEDERLDWLLHKIVGHPPAFSAPTPVTSEEVDRAEALLAKLQADVEAFVRRRAEKTLYNPFPPREHGVGPTLGQ